MAACSACNDCAGKCATTIVLLLIRLVDTADWFCTSLEDVLLMPRGGRTCCQVRHLQ